MTEKETTLIEPAETMAVQMILTGTLLRKNLTAVIALSGDEQEALQKRVDTWWARQCDCIFAIRLQTVPVACEEFSAIRARLSRTKDNAETFDLTIELLFWIIGHDTNTGTAQCLQPESAGSGCVVCDLCGHAMP